ncbi:LacI family transcriptional regulator, repressor for deo operon, udp, cdd, tsx, nupC, and nupG [Lutimaribacter pacificus]|uniref:Transcriptional regulator, LacI family n=1 Tax=Lutimaribacter pacificus TaxID=391948 RepID=A0A1H0C021_9RHOB|nr:LacI family DNA-binding transcriptional regulator [Lutimaribacter pacificus]SDN51244.1 LacI family transcriptional regulator, repressor for deo operon, udp, cdd, tsx, nupC, and nupG [Lutimaribacter pacificus]SHJ50390.1 transcriptional regulator, LacI family [Lutimaribacter pacificus]
MDRKTATIQDVARIAGVSTATVSRTLSKPSVVAKSTREAVLDAVAETGYRVNATASNLRRQRTGTVIVLLPNLANPFFSQILAGLASVLTPAQLGMLIADTQSGPDPEERLRHYLTSGQADGLILLDGTLSPEALAIPGRPPVVLACEWMGHDLPSVRVENARGAALAVGHLARLGHRRIGHVTGPRGNVLTETRLEGFCAALQELGLPLDDHWVLEGDFSMDSGAAAGRAWLGMTDRPTALFLSSDEMAIGFLGEVQRAGIRVPEDVSIVGFDNIEIAQHLSPGLTTIRQPRTQIGVRAAELLLAMIETGSLTGPSELIEVEFIVRGSAGVPPA